MGKSSHDSQCELFGSFGFFVQFALGVLSFMSLVSKNLNKDFLNHILNYYN